MSNEETSWYIDLALCVSPQRTYDVLLPTIGEGFPFDEFENQERRAVRFSNVIDRRNIRMVERRPHTLPTSTTPLNTSRSLDHTIPSRVSRLLFWGLGISEADYI